MSELHTIRDHLGAGQVIPAHPLALTEDRALDEVSQRALTRYYVAAGAGGIAVGVHTTQFDIRLGKHGLFEPVLELAADTADEWLGANRGPFVKVAGIVGRTKQALREARLAADLGYDAGLLSLGGWRDEDEGRILTHCRAVAEVIPLFGFYLQPAVGGRALSHAFWRRFAEIPSVVAIKIAPFNRYQTIDVVRAVADVGRDEIALYTGNDDSIVVDLLTRFPCVVDGRLVERRIVGGLLGHWAMWTRRAVELLATIKRAGSEPEMSSDWLRLGAAVTDANGAIFDVRNDFAGCIPGIHEVLRRQGLMQGTWCLDPAAILTDEHRAEIDRVVEAYPAMSDDEFVGQHLDEWRA
jgi:dihydrodipicolinate synthase/N-acetylneuraminate lyase